jgi:SAM-dependent methyltransferase
MSRGYGADLAHVHDVGFTDFARQVAPWLLGVLRAHGVGRERVVDMGCGSGVWAARLTAAGYDVLGIDQSAPMLRLARRRAPRARFRRGSFVSATLPPCGAVTALGEVLGYAFDPRSGPAALGVFFAKVYGALRPGGVFVFDVAGPGRSGRQRQSFKEGPGWLVVVDRREKGRVLERRIITFRRMGGVYRRREELHRLRLYTPEEIRRALERVGFRVRVLRRFGQVRLGEGQAGFLAIR